jgi:hypothetical protein
MGEGGGGVEPIVNKMFSSWTGTSLSMRCSVSMKFPIQVSRDVTNTLFVPFYYLCIVDRQVSERHIQHSVAANVSPSSPQSLAPLLPTCVASLLFVRLYVDVFGQTPASVQHNFDELV